MNDKYKVNFNIIVVCFNAGDRLKTTLDSIYSQEYWGYHVIIKDGNSTDNSLSSLRESEYFDGRAGEVTTIETGRDSGIYDAMNMAVKFIPESDLRSYIIFMNCGDTFYDRQVLGAVADFITDNEHEGDVPYIFYGNQYNQLTDSVVSSSPAITEFTLFRNVPCHQVCFYDNRLFDERGYNTDYKVRADYEHFLYCVYDRKAIGCHMDLIISKYEGGGFSETKENRELSAKEHLKITDYYMGNRAKRYRTIMMLTGAGIRTRLAESRRFSGIYNGLKSAVYRIKSSR